MNHPIPAVALDSHLAVLGKTGSGKSYAIRSAVEQLLDDGKRVCIVDPTGAWYGLRSSASGARAGYPVVIFGGEHADLELGWKTGETIAEVIGTSSTPTILDTSQMKVHARTQFAADFFDAIMRKNKGPLHLVIDEAHVFMPQGKVASPQAGEMLAAANNAVSGGRARGLRIAMITQRPAKLHKDALTQAETLIAMRLIAPQDRKAVQAWIEDNADAAQAQRVISSLAQLKTGTGWIWAPQLDKLEMVTFPRIRTFDSGRAPDGSETETAKVLAPIDRDAIAARLQSVSAAAIADDPKRLRAEIARLERLVKAGTPAPVLDPLKIAEIEQRAYDKALGEAQAQAVANANALGVRLNEALALALEAHYKAIATGPVFKSTPEATVWNRPKQFIADALKQSERNLKPARAPGNGRAPPSVDLPQGEARILTALIQFPEGRTRSQLMTLTGYRERSMTTYLPRLAQRSYVAQHGGLWLATPAGIEALPDAQPLPTGIDLRRYWLAKLPAGERLILEALVAVHPQEISRDELMRLTNYAERSLTTYLPRLVAKNLIVSSRAGVAASGELF